MSRGTGEGGNIITLGKHLGINIADYQAYTSVQHKRVDLSTAPPTPEPSPFEKRVAIRGKQLDRIYDEPDETFEREFVDTIPESDVILDSPIGTGKTTAGAKVSARSESIVAVNDRRVLVHQLTEGLNLTSYDTATEVWKQERLGTTVDSLHLRVDTEAPDTLYIEEEDYVFRQLASRIMKAGNRDSNALVLQHYIQHSGRVIAVQGNVSPVGVQILKSLRPSMRLVKNTHTPDRGTVTFTTHPAIVAQKAVLTAEQGGLACLTSDSRKNVLEVLEKAHSDTEFDVLAIHGENTSNTKTKELIASINDRVAGQRDTGRGLLLLISPSAAVGFNVDGTTFDFVGTIGCNVVTPETYVQMNMRIRKSTERMVYVPGLKAEKLPTDKDAILSELRDALATTADLADFKAHGIQSASLMQGWITQIDAAYHAFDNVQRQDTLGFTAAYFVRAGFKPILDETEVTTAQVTWLKELRQARRDYAETQTHIQQPITREQKEKLQESGVWQSIMQFGYERFKVEKAGGGRNINLHDGLYERFKNTG